jgi:hypothetical protein
MSQFFDWDTGAVLNDKHGTATPPSQPEPEPTTPILLIKDYRPLTRSQPRSFSAWPATYDQPDQQQSVTPGGNEQNFWDSQRNNELRQECQC